MTRKGKEFFSYTTNLTETIKGLSVEGSKIWTAGVILICYYFVNSCNNNYKKKQKTEFRNI